MTPPSWLWKNVVNKIKLVPNWPKWLENWSEITLKFWGLKKLVKWKNESCSKLDEMTRKMVRNYFWILDLPNPLPPPPNTMAKGGRSFAQQYNVMNLTLYLGLWVWLPSYVAFFPQFHLHLNDIKIKKLGSYFILRYDILVPCPVCQYLVLTSDVGPYFDNPFFSVINLFCIIL